MTTGRINQVAALPPARPAPESRAPGAQPRVRGSCLHFLPPGPVVPLRASGLPAHCNTCRRVAPEGVPRGERFPRRRPLSPHRVASPGARHRRTGPSSPPLGWPWVPPPQPWARRARRLRPLALDFSFVFLRAGRRCVRLARIPSFDPRSGPRPRLIFFSGGGGAPRGRPLHPPRGGGNGSSGRGRNVSPSGTQAPGVRGNDPERLAFVESHHLAASPRGLGGVRMPAPPVPRGGQVSGVQPAIARACAAVLQLRTSASVGLYDASRWTLAHGASGQVSHPSRGRVDARALASAGASGASREQRSRTVGQAAGASPRLACPRTVVVSLTRLLGRRLRAPGG